VKLLEWWFMVKPLILFAIAAAAGYLAGRPERNEVAVSERVTPREVTAKPSREHWEVADLSEWIGGPVKNPEDRIPVTSPPDLSGWSTKELQAALDAAVGPEMTTLSQTEWYQLIRMLLEEWGARDFDAVVGWFEAIPSAEVRRRVDGVLGGIWPVERGEEALDFVIRNGLNDTVRGGISYPLFLSKAMSAAARNGPEAVARVVATAAGHGMESRYSGAVKFPEGFDFAALAAQPGLAEMVRRGHVFFAGAWAAQDPVAAFEQLIMKSGRRDSSILESWMSDAVNQAERGDSSVIEERFQWLAGRAGEMEPEAAAGLGTNLAASQRVGTHDGAIEFRTFVGLLADKELRKLAAQRAVQQTVNYSLGIGSTTAILERAGTPEERLEILRSVLVEERPPGFRGFTQAEEQRFRQSLSAWGVAADQTDQLMNEIKAAK
jgi:hypothetical protein